MSLQEQAHRHNTPAAAGSNGWSGFYQFPDCNPEVCVWNRLRLHRHRKPAIQMTGGIRWFNEYCNSWNFTTCDRMKFMNNELLTLSWFRKIAGEIHLMVSPPAFLMSIRPKQCRFVPKLLFVKIPDDKIEVLHLEENVCRGDYEEYG